MEAENEKPELIAVEVEPDLQAMLDRFPLPPGIADADMNQEEIAQALGTTVNTVAKWIRSDAMPVAQQGGAGKAYVLRLSHCFAWKKAKDADASARSQHNKNQISALQAEFLGFAVEDQASALTPRQRAELADADVKWSKAQHLRRQLVPLMDVRDLLEELMKTVRDGVEAMPDLLERELSLKPEQVAAASRIGEDILKRLAAQIEERHLGEDVAEVEVQPQWVV